MNSAQKTLESMNQAVWYNQWTLKKFEQYLKYDILEVGCGIGNFTLTLTKYGQVWAIDIVDQYIKATKKLTGGKAQVGFGDIEKGKYFFGDKKFDSVVCLNVLEHIKNDSKAVQNLANLLEVGGFLILLVPAHTVLYGTIDESIGHLRRYQKEELCLLIEGLDFKTIFSRRINFLGALGWWFSSKILKDKTVKASRLWVFNFLAPIFLSIENLIEPKLGISILVVAQKIK